MGSGRGRKTIGLVAAGLAMFGVGQAIGATEQITSSPTCCQFSKPSFTIDAGQVANFSNTGDTSHDVTANDNGPDSQKLFESATIAAGQNSAVNGTQYLSAGTYGFFCSIHPEMTASLTVGAGTPVARPDVSLKVLSKKIDQVVDSARLRVKVTAAAQSDDVKLVAKKGARTLASKGNIDLAAGTSKTLKLKLIGSGRVALSGLNSAKVKVAATVPFGEPASAKRKLK